MLWRALVLFFVFFVIVVVKFIIGNGVPDIVLRKLAPMSKLVVGDTYGH